MLSMNGSVGLYGKNTRQDVRLIQTLLNAVPANRGGPSKPLKVDGIVGQHTLAAIKLFQQANTRIVDCRVDPGGPTIQKLVPIVDSVHALPVGFNELQRADQKIVSALGSVLKRSQIRGGGPIPPTFPTEWRFTTSGAFNISIGPLGVGAGDLVIQRDSQPGVDYRLTFVGMSVGVSFMPIGFDVSFEQLPTWGTRIEANGKKPPLPFPPSRFEGPCVLISLSGSVGPALGGTMVDFLSCDCGGFLAGVQVGMPGGELSLLLGSIAGWR
jgi:peptidoglycan hydrolase-like protein with peptidoglycan-binding domain